MTEEELKPCPFFGSSFIDLNRGGWWVWCGECGAEGSVKETREEALAAWNRRANEGEQK